VNLAGPLAFSSHHFLLKEFINLNEKLNSLKKKNFLFCFVYLQRIFSYFLKLHLHVFSGRFLGVFLSYTILFAFFSLLMQQ